MNEQLLVENCKQGQSSAQHLLYQKYADALYATTFRYLGERMEAEDAATEAFLKIFGNIHTFEWRGERSLWYWMKRIAVNEALMKIRKRKQMDIISIDGASPVYFGAEQEQALSNMSVNEIMAVIHTMPIGYRTVFNLYIFEDRSHAEIAAHLGISEVTSRSQLYKARKLLQEYILKQKHKSHE
ncbi:MAG: sigma-70 family RNA polymerase sigma factor [Sphingobacteriales bacterium]|nr:MAG: sigma-70 family RNA polymerase sigma factor [Sphingobacteriales bacterium]